MIAIRDSATSIMSRISWQPSSLSKCSITSKANTAEKLSCLNGRYLASPMMTSSYKSFKCNTRAYDGNTSNATIVRGLFPNASSKIAVFPVPAPMSRHELSASIKSAKKWTGSKPIFAKATNQARLPC